MWPRQFFPDVSIASFGVGQQSTGSRKNLVLNFRFPPILLKIRSSSNQIEGHQPYQYDPGQPNDMHKWYAQVSLIFRAIFGQQIFYSIHPM
jgi:hypothetical protein